MKTLGWRIALYFALVFAGGIAVGALANRYVVHPPGPPHMNAERFRQDAIKDMTKRLGLDASQVKQLEGIFDQSHREFTEFNEKHRDERHAIYDRMNERVALMLTPAQKIEFDKLTAERKAAAQAHEKKDREEHDRPAPAR